MFARNPASRWSLYGWSLIFIWTLFQALQWPLLPRFVDIYYHLNVMKGFADAGGYVTTAFWENAPLGRPHLYPPLLHIWMWMAFKLGLPAISVGRLVDCLSYPALLFVWYRVASRLYSTRVAFWALVLYASSYSATLASVTLAAFNLAFILGLLALCNAEKGRGWRGGLLLGLCFYTHTFAACLFSFSMVLNACFAPQKCRVYMASILAGIVTAAPFLIYQIHFKDFFGFVTARENSLWEADLLVYGLLIPALWGYTKLKVNANVRWALCLMLGMLPLVLTHPVRFFGGQGMMGAALLAAVMLDAMAKNEKWLKADAALRTSVSAFFLFFVLFLAPHAEWRPDIRKLSLGWADRMMTRFVRPDLASNVRDNSFSIFYKKPYQEIAKVIRENSKPDDILWADFPYVAGIMSLLTDRATSCAMLAEMRPYEESNRLSDARILLWFRDKDGQPLQGMWETARQYDLKLIQETEMGYVFQNPKDFKKSSLPKPLIPAIWLAILGVAAMGVVLASLDINVN